MLRILLSLIILLIISSSANSLELKREDVLTVCYFNDAYPMMYDDDGATGYEADFLRIIAQRIGVRLEFIEEKRFNDIWISPSSNHSICDLSSGFIIKSDDREEGVMFTNSVVDISHGLLVKSSSNISSYNDLSSILQNKQRKAKLGIAVGRHIGNSSLLYVKHKLKELSLSHNVEIIKYESISHMLEALMSGDVDAAELYDIIGMYYTNMDDTLSFVANENLGEKVAFSVRENAKDLLNAINTEINMILEDDFNYHEWLQQGY